MKDLQSPLKQVVENAHTRQEEMQAQLQKRLKKAQYVEMGKDAPPYQDESLIGWVIRHHGEKKTTLTEFSPLIIEVEVPIALQMPRLDLSPAKRLQIENGLSTFRKLK